MPRTAQQFEEIRKTKVKLIMDTALELFANEGYHSTSISKIAKKANISKGLMYNYFSGKEELLKAIIESVNEELTNMMNPDHDDKITQNEAMEFVDLYFDMLKEKREYQKLIFQLSVQPSVKKLIHKLEFSGRVSKTQALWLRYFKQQKSDPVSAILVLNSVLKGFAIQYVFSPELFPNEMIDDFKNYIKSLLLNSCEGTNSGAKKHK